MIVQETDSVLIFRDVSYQEIVFFKEFPFNLWFLKGEVSDGIFKQSFIGSDWDLSEYEVMDDDDKLDIVFTLYFLKIK